VVADTAAPSTSVDASFWHAEDLATSRVRQAREFTYQLGNESLSCEPDTLMEDGIHVVLPPPGKARTAVSNALFFFPQALDLLIRMSSVATNAGVVPAQ
jgi:hypothetical protein